MRKAVLSKQFVRDTKRMQRRQKDTLKLREVMRLLLLSEPLPLKYRDHRLSGEFIGARECHIEPDWLVIYRIEDDTIRFERTGSHSDLFGK